jgi:hypothetical protein
MKAVVIALSIAAMCFFFVLGADVGLQTASGIVVWDMSGSCPSVADRLRDILEAVEAY